MPECASEAVAVTAMLSAVTEPKPMVTPAGGVLSSMNAKEAGADSFNA